MSNPNDRQVGGNHYKTGGVELWELFGPPFLMGYATKYLRWRKKNGVEDLEKAIHIVEKLREVIVAGDNYINNYVVYPRDVVEGVLRNWGLNEDEKRIAYKLLYWVDPTDIDNAIDGLRFLIETAPTVGNTLEGSEGEYGN